MQRKHIFQVKMENLKTIEQVILDRSNEDGRIGLRGGSRSLYVL